jgi:hypothetical protein
VLAGWAPGLVWTGAENLAPTGIKKKKKQMIHVPNFSAMDTVPDFLVSLNKPK